MICPKCGAEIPDDSIFCLNCGASLNDAQADVQTEAAPAAELPHYLDPGGFSYKLREQLKSPMFLVICILLTAAALPIGQLPILTIIFTVAAWITYSNAMKDTPKMDVGGLKFLAGTMTASYVINWVVFGMMALATVFELICLPFVIMAESEISSAFNVDEFFATYNDMLVSVYGEEFALSMQVVLEQYEKIIEFIYSNLVLVFIILTVFLVLYTVVIGIYNGVFYSRFKKLAKGMHQSYVRGDSTKLNFKGIPGLLMTVGIVRLVWDFVNLIAFTGVEVIFSSCISVTFILASLWVKQLVASLEGSEEE